jgi:hypothetical protein
MMTIEQLEALIELAKRGAHSLAERIFIEMAETAVRELRQAAVMKAKAKEVKNAPDNA